MPVYLMESISSVALAVHQNASVTTRGVRFHVAFTRSFYANVRTGKNPP
jgi:hypothetical protein